MAASDVVAAPSSDVDGSGPTSGKRYQRNSVINYKLVPHKDHNVQKPQNNTAAENIFGYHDLIWDKRVVLCLVLASRSDDAAFAARTRSSSAPA